MDNSSREIISQKGQQDNFYDSTSSRYCTAVSRPSIWIKSPRPEELKKKPYLNCFSSTGVFNLDMLRLKSRAIRPVDKNTAALIRPK